MAKDESSLLASLEAHYRQPKVNWKIPTLPPISVPNATLAAYYREPKVNWKIPTLPPISVLNVLHPEL